MISFERGTSVLANNDWYHPRALRRARAQRPPVPRAADVAPVLRVSMSGLEKIVNGVLCVVKGSVFSVQGLQSRVEGDARYPVPKKWPQS